MCPEFGDRPQRISPAVAFGPAGAVTRPLEGKAAQDFDGHNFVALRRLDKKSSGIKAGAVNLLIPSNKKEFRLDIIRVSHAHR